MFNKSQNICQLGQATHWVSAGYLATASRQEIVKVKTDHPPPLLISTELLLQIFTVSLLCWFSPGLHKSKVAPETKNKTFNLSAISYKPRWTLFLKFDLGACITTSPSKCVCTWSLRVHCSVQISVIRFLACLAISSRNMLHNDRLRSPMWWRWGCDKSMAY